MSWLIPRLLPSDRVIDVGAGTGRYLPYLAGQVADVIAVEPSPAMNEELRRTLDDAGAANVRVVDASWPLAEPLSADVVISAHVVYGVREIAPFLNAIDAAASRLCALYLGLRHPTWSLSPFWERMHGEPRLPLPAALETLAACHQIGLPARLDLVAVPPSFRFAGREEALEELGNRLRVSPTPERIALIEAAIDELLIADEDGLLSPVGGQREAAVIWWQPVHT